MKMIYLIIVLLLIFQRPAFSQGSFGGYSEKQIIEILKEASTMTSAESQKNANNEEKSRARKFLAEHKTLLESLGKREAFYYLRMMELARGDEFGQVDRLAYIVRGLFWLYRDEYTEGEAKELDQAKEFLSRDPEGRQKLEAIAKQSATDADQQKHKSDRYKLRDENILEPRILLPTPAAITPKSKPASPSATPAPVANPASFSVLAAVLFAAVAGIGIVLFLRRGKVPKA